MQLLFYSIGQGDAKEDTGKEDSWRQTDRQAGRKTGLPSSEIIREGEAHKVESKHSHLAH